MCRLCDARLLRKLGIPRDQLLVRLWRQGAREGVRLFGLIVGLLLEEVRRYCTSEHADDPSNPGPYGREIVGGGHP